MQIGVGRAAARQSDGAAAFVIEAFIGRMLEKPPERPDGAEYGMDETVRSPAPWPPPWGNPAPHESLHAADSTPLSLAWLQPMGVVGLSAFNYVMRILTLGIYHFWGKTEVRKRIWASVRLDGEPLVYTGTGRELFLGFLVIFGVVLLPLALLSFAAVVAFGPQSPMIAVFQTLVYVLFFLLYGVATYRAQRYRLSRTRWRGIRGGMDGSSWRYGLTHFWTGLLIPLTFGWIIPWRSTRLQHMLVSDMRFGDQPFRFTASARPLYLRFLLLWLGTIAIAIIAAAAVKTLVMESLLTLDPTSPRGYTVSPTGAAAIAAVALAAYFVYSVVSAWYRASQINHFAAHTHFDGATFRADVTAGGLVWLTVGNLLLVLLSLGVLTAVAQVRSARYYISHLAIDGPVALATVAQGADHGLTKGEGLAQAFDVDAF